MVLSTDGSKNGEGYVFRSKGRSITFDIRIVCVSPSNDPEGPDTYIDFIDFNYPTYRGVTRDDSIYSLIDAYGAPDDIREGSWSGNKDVVYEYEGNELVFTITPDNTVAFFEIDFAE